MGLGRTMLLTLAGLFMIGGTFFVSLSENHNLTDHLSLALRAGETAAQSGYMAVSAMIYIWILSLTLPLIITAVLLAAMEQRRR